jgi:hypothetical protein
MRKCNLSCRKPWPPRFCRLSCPRFSRSLTFHNTPCKRCSVRHFPHHGRRALSPSPRPRLPDDDARGNGDRRRPPRVASPHASAPGHEHAPRLCCACAVILLHLDRSIPPTTPATVVYPKARTLYKPRDTRTARSLRAILFSPHNSIFE